VGRKSFKLLRPARKNFPAPFRFSRACPPPRFLFFRVRFTENIWLAAEIFFFFFFFPIPLDFSPSFQTGETIWGQKKKIEGQKTPFFLLLF